MLIHGGAPDHAALVVDMAENLLTRQKYLLLAQSYMPAQSIHVLENIDCEAAALRSGAWFAVPEATKAQFETPEWTFEREELGRF